MKDNIQLSNIINDEVDQLYKLSFFEPFLTNYIADFKPEIAASMTQEDYLLYLQMKDAEATHEFCRCIVQGLTIDEAKSNALDILLSEVR